MMMINF